MSDYMEQVDASRRAIDDKWRLAWALPPAERFQAILSLIERKTSDPSRMALQKAPPEYWNVLSQMKPFGIVFLQAARAGNVIVARRALLRIPVAEFGPSLAGTIEADYITHGPAATLGLALLAEYGYVPSSIRPDDWQEILDPEGPGYWITVRSPRVRALAGPVLDWSKVLATVTGPNLARYLMHRV